MSSDHYVRPDWFTQHVFNPLVAALTRLGLSVYGSRILAVRGRKSGLWRQTPVNLLGGVLQPWVLVEDLNHDGKPDIITASEDQYGDTSIQTFLNNGNSTFRAGSTYNYPVTGGQLLAS